jgi:hypothetical protein
MMKLKRFFLFSIDTYENNIIYLLIFLTFTEWEGFWEEDQHQRQNLAQFLDARPEFSWFEKIFANSASFGLTMNIKKEEDYIGSYLSMHGKRGPLKQFYQSEIVPDNVTRTDIDMDQFGKIFFFFFF